MRSPPVLVERLEAAADSSGLDGVDMVIREQNAVTYAMQLHEELARERAAHEQTRRSLARAYDVIAAVRKATSGGQS